jgi:hypothetical protein
MRSVLTSNLVAAAPRWVFRGETFRLLQEETMVMRHAYSTINNQENPVNPVKNTPPPPL